ncbi:unnamed protein product [Brassica napus]|uniref:(rape) hypothetical protein n=1 Tax=Brassica napus TaxID=3708 RepID=A0A816JH60_BRANA|nr:unnamed protein product [Brassica napus]
MSTCMTIGHSFCNLLINLQPCVPRKRSCGSISSTFYTV